MLTETNRDLLINSLTGITDVNVYRTDNDRITDTDAYISVSFLPTRKKIGKVIGNYMGQMESNSNYSEYSFGQVETVAVRSFQKDNRSNDARDVALQRLTGIERFIKVNWNTLINSGSIDQGTYGNTPLVDYKMTRMYGWEFSFDIITENYWNNMPLDEDSVKSEVDISGLSIGSGLYLWVNI